MKTQLCVQDVATKAATISSRVSAQHVDDCPTEMNIACLFELLLRRFLGLLHHFTYITKAKI